jgi:tRNA A-37 threonylcarbamoyl transferase component Bud32
MAVSRYREETILGTGGMAEVWKARGPRGAVAMKRLLPHAARNPSLSAAFEREGRLLSRLEHPNVIGIQEMIRDERGTCLVLEYVEGADLRVLEPGATPARMALRIIRDLLRALEAVHDLRDDDGRPLGLIHRDLSPSNVLVGVDGSVKLTDFGIARALSGSQAATTGTNIKGTLAYLPPEQASGAPVDSRADLFAVGALLYEMLVGAPIYDESEPRLALARARAGDVASLAAVRPETPMPIVELVDRALSAVPSDRYPSAQAMRAELERVADQTGGLATTEEFASWVRSLLAGVQGGAPTLTGASSSPTRTVTSTRWAPALALLGLIAAAFLWWMMRSPRPTSAVAAAEGQTPIPTAPGVVPGPETERPVSAVPSSSPLSTPAALTGRPDAPEKAAKEPARAPKEHAEALTGEQGLLDIGSEPGFAYVSIDGVRVGPTPIFGRAIAPGTHKIEVSREGLGSKTFSLDVRPGARISRVVKLP